MEFMMKRELTARQNEIVDAALHLIAEKGMRNLTIRHLSQAPGVWIVQLFTNHNRYDMFWCLDKRRSADI